MSGAAERITCSVARGHFIDRALAQATPGEAAAVAAHLAGCADCRAEAAALRQTLALLQAPALVAPSAAFHQRLTAALDEVDARARRRGSRRERGAARLLDHARFRFVLLGHQLRHSRRWQLRVAAALLPLCFGIALLVRDEAAAPPLDVARSAPPAPALTGDPERPLAAPDLVQWTPRFDDPVEPPTPPAVAPPVPAIDEATPPEPEVVRPVLDRLSESNDAELARLRAIEKRSPTENATVAPPRTPLERALDWLARNQAPDGGWSPGDGTPGFETGVTALVLMALVADGHLGSGTPAVATGPTAALEQVQEVAAQRAVEWLLARQEADGRFRGGGDPGVADVGHALATLALVERHQQLRARQPNASAANAAAHDRLEQALSRVEITLDRVLHGDRSPHVGAIAAWSALALATAREGGVDFHLKPSSDALAERMLAQLRAERSDLLFAASHAAQAMAARAPAPAQRDPEWARAIGNVVAGLGHAEPALRFLVATALVGASGTSRGDWEQFAGALERELLPQQGRSGFFAADVRWQGLGGGTAYETALGALALQVETRQRTFVAARGVLRGKR